MPTEHKEHYEAVSYRGKKIMPWAPEHERLAGIISMIPEGVKRILDCGCGDGRLGNLLKDQYEVQGCDISSAALRNCEFHTIQCSLTGLAFDDRYFDLVICSEVLEHILPADYRRACREIERVSDKWIIVTVPYLEDLSSARQQCPHCGSIFHDAWHMRSIDEAIIRESFENFMVRRFYYLGHKQRLDCILRRRLYNWLIGYPRLAANRQCPLCHCFGTPSGKQEIEESPVMQSDPRRSRPQWYNKLREFALRVVPGRSRWLGVLLERK